MALKQADRVESNNPSAYGIVRAVEVTGHRTVKDLPSLYSIPDCILSDSKTNSENDAIGQEWYVISESSYYSLINWENRKSSSGWVQSVAGDGSNITLKGFETLPEDQITEEQLTPVPSDTVNTGIAKLHRAILNNEEVEAAALVKIKESVGLGDDLSYSPTADLISGAKNISEALDTIANNSGGGNGTIDSEVLDNVLDILS